MINGNKGTPLGRHAGFLHAIGFNLDCVIGRRSITSHTASSLQPCQINFLKAYSLGAVTDPFSFWLPERWCIFKNKLWKLRRKSATEPFIASRNFGCLIVSNRNIILASISIHPERRHDGIVQLRSKRLDPRVESSGMDAIGQKYDDHRLLAIHPERSA